MMHPHTRLAPLGDALGFSVVATQPIPAGTIVWVRDPLDRLLSRDEARSLGPLFHGALRHFTFWEAHHSDLVLCWDHGRYVNHSCDANCLGGGFEFELAVRDIAPGEQLTDDYGSFGVYQDFECTCGAEACRGRVRRTDAAALGAWWDARLLGALAHLPSVPQPLWSLVQDKGRVEASLVDRTAAPLHRVA